MAGTAILSALLGFTVTHRTIVTVTNIHTPIVTMFSSTSPFMVFGVCETIGVGAATSGAAKTHAPPSATKTVQPASADTASPRNVWTPMTVPLSQSPANESPKSDADSTEWAKKLELRLNQVSPDMRAASALLEQEGFRVNSGKSATGWYLTAHDRYQRRGSIRLQSDGTKIDLTVAGGKDEARY
jgi:hypothetical protein